jgi:hypothetical protein
LIFYAFLGSFDGLLVVVILSFEEGVVGEGLQLGLDSFYLFDTGICLLAKKQSPSVGFFKRANHA